jgi:hypothetical protein
MSVPAPSVEKNASTRRKRAPAPPAAGLPLMTRQQVVRFLNANGIPISESTLAKLCAPSVNRGPPVASWWGKRPLYAPGLHLIGPNRCCAKRRLISPPHSTPKTSPAREEIAPGFSISQIPKGQPRMDPSLQNSTFTSKAAAAVLPNKRGTQ